jgi:hypothetical protein
MYIRSRLYLNLHSSVSIAAAALFALLCSNFASGQTTSTMEGTVTDKQGLAVAGAQVRAEGVSIVADRSATTDSEGEYRLGGAACRNIPIDGHARWIPHWRVRKLGGHAEPYAALQRSPGYWEQPRSN